MSRPQQSKRQSIPRRTQATAQEQIDDDEVCNSKVAMLILAVSLLIPFLWQYGSPNSTLDDLDVNGRSSGLPSTWEGLQHDTLQNFREGIPSTTLPNFFLESVQGFEMTFFEGDSVYSLGYFLQRTGNENVTTSSWSVPLKQTQYKPVRTSSIRTISYMHPVSNPLAPPMARATKTQRLERYHRDTTVIQTLTVVQDVPMADCFVVEERMFVENTGKNGLKLSAYFQIQFTQETMFRSIIEKQTSIKFVEYFQNYRSFLMAIATRQPHTWEPRKGNRSDRSVQTTGSQSSMYPKKKLGKFVVTAVLHPFRFALQQLRKLTRALQNWQRSLGKKMGWVMVH
jgi:hypothetical protein